jgi:hypothetical protein
MRKLGFKYFFFCLFVLSPQFLFAQASGTSTTSPGDEPGFWASILQDFWEWLKDIVFDVGFTIFETVIEALGFDISLGVGSEIMKWFKIGNYYFPVDLLISLLFIYWTFAIGFIVVKMILKLVPTIG